MENKNSTLSELSDFVPEGEYQPGQTVQLIIKKETDLGYKAIVDGKYWGVLYYNEVFQRLDKNQEIAGFVKKVREDGRLDITLYKTGYDASFEVADQILNELKVCGGYLDINDKTDAERIYNLFGVSKKKYKMALGGLYKKRLIEIKEDGIYLPIEKKSHSIFTKKKS